MNNKSEKILDATIKLFIKNGVKKTTMDEIAEYANVSKVTIYKYFGDKNSLYLSVGSSILDHYIKALNSIVSNENELNQRILSYIDILADFTNSGKLSLCFELSKYNDRIEIEYAAYLKNYKNVLVRLIKEGKKENKIREDIDNNSIFYYIDMSVSYYQQNLEYRKKMQKNIKFQKEFMKFYVSNIFIDTVGIL